jgi:hypothetical protein
VGESACGCLRETVATSGWNLELSGLNQVKEECPDRRCRTCSSFFSSYSRSSQDSLRFPKSCAVLPHSPQSRHRCRYPSEDLRASSGVALSPSPTQAMRPLPRDGDIFDAYNDLQNGATRPQGSSSPKRALLLYHCFFHRKGLSPPASLSF